MARSAECKCESNFTCRYCLRNAKPWHFTCSSGAVIPAVPVDLQRPAPQPGSKEWLAAKSKGPRWEYEDAAGVPHVGYMQTFTDRGGTDVTYWFRDAVTGELSLVSGSRLKAARRIWE